MRRNILDKLDWDWIEIERGDGPGQGGTQWDNYHGFLPNKDR